MVAGMGRLTGVFGESARRVRRKPRASINQLAGMVDRLPVFALSYLADALAASNDKGPRYQDVVRRLTNALRIEADRAHVEEKDDDALAWLWNTNVRATAVVLDGLSRRKDVATPAAPLSALADRRTSATADGRRRRTRWRSRRSSRIPRLREGRAAHDGGRHAGQCAGWHGDVQWSIGGIAQIQVSMPDLQNRMTGSTPAALSISRSGTGRVHYTARLQVVRAESAGRRRSRDPRRAALRALT